MKLSFNNIFFALGTVFLIFGALVVAKALLIPLGFGLLLSFILLPLAKRFESWGLNRILAALTSMLSVFIIIAAGAGFFSNQVLQLSQELNHFQERIINTFTEISVLFNRHLSFLGTLDDD